MLSTVISDFPSITVTKTSPVLVCVGISTPLSADIIFIAKLFLSTNDNDDKLVIVPEEKEYSNDAIKALTEFQERFFESIIIDEKSMRKNN